MNMTRFVANLEGARNNAIIVMQAKNEIARGHASDLLDAYIENMIEELDTTVIGQYRIDKDALLKSLLEDAELQIGRYDVKRKD